MKLFKNGIFTWKKTIFVAVLLNIATIVTVLIVLSHIPPVVPLYYGNVAGKLQLSPSSGLLIPPSFVLVFVLMNAIISSNYKDHFLSSLLVWSSVIFTILSTITVLKIILLVGSL